MARIIRSSLTGVSERPEATVYTDASRPDVRACQDDVHVGTVGHMVHGQVHIDSMYLAQLALGQIVRDHLARARRWSRVGSRLGQSGNHLRGLDFEQSPVRYRFVSKFQQLQPDVRVTGGVGDGGPPPLCGLRHVQGEGLQKESLAGDEKKRGPEAPEIVDITGDIEFVDLTN